MTNEVFPNSKYPYMNDATGVLDAELDDNINDKLNI